MVQRALSATAPHVGPFSSRTYRKAHHRSSESSHRKIPCRCSRSPTAIHRRCGEPERKRIRKQFHSANSRFDLSHAGHSGKYFTQTDLTATCAHVEAWPRSLASPDQLTDGDVFRVSAGGGSPEGTVAKTSDWRENLSTSNRGRPPFLLGQWWKCHNFRTSLSVGQYRGTRLARKDPTPGQHSFVFHARIRLQLLEILVVSRGTL